MLDSDDRPWPSLSLTRCVNEMDYTPGVMSQGGEAPEDELGEGQGRNRGKNLAVSGCARPYPRDHNRTLTRRGTLGSADKRPRAVSARTTGKPRSPPAARASSAGLASWRPPFALGEGQVGAEGRPGRVGVGPPYPRAASSYAAVKCSVNHSPRTTASELQFWRWPAASAQRCAGDRSVRT